MKDKSICLTDTVIEASEHKSYLELISRVCYYNDVNSNDVILPYDEGAEERAQTLVNMPVQAKYRTNSKGEPTFGSHEKRKSFDGTVTFGTSSIGVNTEVYIKEEKITTYKGEEKILPCLYAKYRIWKRYKNVIEAVKRLFSLGKLYCSWELKPSVYEYKDGITIFKDYEFLANTLLGYEYASPSYGNSAKALSIAEVLSKDIINEGGKEMDKIENAEAQLTSEDLFRLLENAINEKIGTCYYVAFYFPEEKEIWVKTESDKKSFDYTKFTYSLENEKINLSEPEKITLKVSPRDINVFAAELEEKIAGFEKIISENNEALAEASKEASDLMAEIESLKPYKKSFEAAEKEKLINDVIMSGLITREEIEQSEEFTKRAESLDRDFFNSLIGQRYTAALAEKAAKNKTEKKNIVTAQANLNGNNKSDAKSIMREYFKY